MTSQPGISSYLANKILDHVFRNVAYTPPTTVYVKQHLDQPGAAGTANPSAVTTRIAATWAAASGGAITLTTTFPVFTETATETERFVSLWDASTSGNFLVSGILTTAVAEQSGYTFTFNVCTISFAGCLAS